MDTEAVSEEAPVQVPEAEAAPTAPVTEAAAPASEAEAKIDE